MSSKGDDRRTSRGFRNSASEEDTTPQVEQSASTSNNGRPIGHGRGRGSTKSHSNFNPEETEVAAKEQPKQQGEETLATLEVSEELQAELEKLFFAGKAKCVNGHTYKRVSMMGPCPICSGLQYQFSPDEPLFDYEFNPAQEEPQPSSSRSQRRRHHFAGDEDELVDQIERDRLLAAEMQAQEQHPDDDLPEYGSFLPSHTWPWLKERKEAETAPPAPPEKVVAFYIDFEKTFDADHEFEARNHFEARYHKIASGPHKGYLLPPFPSLTMDEKYAIWDGRTAKQRGKKEMAKHMENEEYNIVKETSKRYHRLNPVPVDLTTDIFCQRFRWARDRIWKEIKTQVMEEFAARERKEMPEIDAGKLTGQSQSESESYTEEEEDEEDKEDSYEDEEEEEEEEDEDKDDKKDFEEFDEYCKNKADEEASVRE